MINTDFTGTQPIFESRHDAGVKLAARLEQYKNRSVIVLAIPNGGVQIAMPVATALNAELDVIIVRKVPIPLTPEAGFGAIADDGTMILNDELAKRLNLTRQQIDYEASRVREEIKKRTMLYKGERAPIRISGQTVILIDDGLASGITMTAAVESVRHRRPREVVVAVPCASGTAVKKLEVVADKVVTVVTSYAPMFAVADFYKHWYDVSDTEVVRYLSQWRTQRYDSIRPKEERPKEE